MSTPRMSRPKTTADLPSVDANDLSCVTGGTAGMDPSMMVIMMLLRGKQGQPQMAAPAPAPEQKPWSPNIAVDGVGQPVSRSADGSSYSATSDGTQTAAATPATPTTPGPGGISVSTSVVMT